MTDNCAAQGEQRLVNVSTAFVTDAQTAELVQPTQSAFDHPAGFAQATAMRPTCAGQLVGNAQPLQPPVMRAAAIGSITLQGVGTLTRPTSFATERGHGQH